ncbi:MAG: hypothetical protein JKY48_09995 [Flavobacteriales bacterium]|nr:hypothetical protein [Flavobacteriales bacterium]
MNKILLDYIADPIDNSKLELINEKYDDLNRIISGELISKNGNKYKIINGIPRFVELEKELKEGVYNGLKNQDKFST